MIPSLHRQKAVLKVVEKEKVWGKWLVAPPPKKAVSRTLIRMGMTESRSVGRFVEVTVVTLSMMSHVENV